MFIGCVVEVMCVYGIGEKGGSMIGRKLKVFGIYL